MDLAHFVSITETVFRECNAIFFVKNVYYEFELHFK